MFREQTSCRMCGSGRLTTFFDLGDQPLANNFIYEKDFSNEAFFPLQVRWCRDCHLMQLGHVVDKKLMFSNYLYLTSGNPDFPEHFANYAEDVVTRFMSDKKDGLVIDIGSNDGLLLRAFKAQGATVLGIEPAHNVAEHATRLGVETIPEFFSEALARKIVRERGQSRVLLGNNVVAHINDHHDLVRGCRLLLDEKGVFIFEAPYLIDMFENLTFDTIYHEHLSYLAISPLKKMFESFGLEIFDVEIQPIHGQSIRVYVARRGAYPVLGRVAECLALEQKWGLGIIKSYQGLVEKIEQSREKLQALLLDLKSKGKKIAAYGAPAKGNTLLNYLDIGRDVIDFVTDEQPTKIGRFTPGTHLPVVSADDARKTPPDYYLMLAWNYKDAILKKEEKYRKMGGKFIYPVQGISIL